MRHDNKKPPLHAIYSSNDSGFSNEIPPAPEVDYSDDEMPKKIPIRCVCRIAQRKCLVICFECYVPRLFP